MLPYNWRSLWHIPTFKGKLKRIFSQFSPYNWIEFDWRPTASLKRFIFVIFVLVIFLLAELNTFYLKYILWIPPPNILCLGRLVFIWLVGAVAMRESFEYLDNPYVFFLIYFLFVSFYFEKIKVCVKEWELRHG
jgi:phosphatidylserine synthase 2